MNNSSTEQPSSHTATRFRWPHYAVLGGGLLVFVLLLLADRSVLETQETEVTTGQPTANALPAANPAFERPVSLEQLPPASGPLAAAIAAYSGNPEAFTDSELQEAIARATEANRLDLIAFFAIRQAERSNNPALYLQAAQAAQAAAVAPPAATDEQLRSQFSREAYRLYGQYLAQQPQDVDAQVAQALTYVQSGDESIIMQGIQQLVGLSQVHPERADILLQLGQFSMQTRQFDKALERFAAVVELEPNNAEAHFLLGLAYDGLGDAQQAIAAWQRAQQLTQNEELLRSIRQRLSRAGQGGDIIRTP